MAWEQSKIEMAHRNLLYEEDFLLWRTIKLSNLNLNTEWGTVYLKSIFWWRIYKDYISNKLCPNNSSWILPTASLTDLGVFRVSKYVTKYGRWCSGSHSCDIDWSWSKSLKYWLWMAFLVMSIKPCGYTFHLNEKRCDRSLLLLFLWFDSGRGLA